MEKRTLIRNRTQLTVSCSCLTSNNPAHVLEGTMLNCSCGGTCIELNQRLQEGTIVMIKVDSWITQEDTSEVPEGFRSLSLAEVKWSKSRDDGAISS